MDEGRAGIFFLNISLKWSPDSASWWWRKYKSGRPFQVRGCIQQLWWNQHQKARLGKAARVIRELDKIGNNRYINLPTRMQFYNACVMSTLLYGAECWTLKDKDENRLDAFDMRCQREILMIRWYQYLSNIDIRKKTNQQQLSSII